MMNHSSSVVCVGDRVRIVRRDTREYEQVIAQCTSPLEAGTPELVYTEISGNERRAAACDTSGYADLLVHAGCEAARIDMERYVHKRMKPTL